MTWADFKKLVNEAGIHDDMLISYIDINGEDDVCVTIDEETGEWSAWC